MTYDYRAAIKNDVKAYIKDNYDYLINDADEAYETLYDAMWIEDSVTGNASGSYTFNRAKAREYVEPNIVLVVEALREFGYELNTLGEKLDGDEWEWLDVTIRCYLLSEALTEVLEEMQVTE